MLRKLLALTVLAVASLSPVSVSEVSAQPIFGKAPQTAVPNAWDSTTIIISSDTATISRGAHTLAAESGTTDDLATVVTTNLLTGHTAIIKADTGDTITIKHGTGNITTDTGADLVITGAQRATLYVTASGVDASLGGGGSGGRKVADYAEMQALSVAALSDGDAVYVRDGARKGYFIWDSSDLSTEVGLDTGEFVYVAPDSDDTGASGAYVRDLYKALNVINIDWGGAAGDGSTDDAAIIEDWLVTASKLQACATATRKTYLVGVGSALDITFDADLCMEMHAGAKLKGITDTGAEILRLDGVTRDLSFTLRGSGDAGFDMTEFEWDGLGQNEGSGLSVQRWGSVLIDGIFFNAGTDYLDGIGDTCLGLSDVYDVRVVNSRFWGCDDEGIYATGGGGLSGTDDGGSTVITNNLFRYNSGGISVRRQGKEYLISENIVLDGHTGIKGVEAGSSGGDLVPPPAEMQVQNNKIYRMLTRAIELRGITAATLVTGNQMHDINGEEGVWPCVNLLGTTRVRMSKNVCDQRTYDQTTSRGVSVNDWIMVNGSADTDGDDGVAVASDATFTSAGVTLTSGMVGRTIRIVGAGADGANLTTTIASFTDANTVELTAAPSTSVNPTLFVIAGDSDAVDLPYAAVHNYVNDNDFAGVSTAIYDGSLGVGGQDGVLAVLNNFDGVATKYSGNVVDNAIDFDGDTFRVGGDVVGAADISIATRESIRVYRSTTDSQYVDIESLSNGAFVRGYSDASVAKGFRFDARTSSGAAPSGGSLYIDFSINGTEHLRVNQDGSTVLQNPGASDALPAAGHYPVTYNGGRMISDPDDDKLLSFTDDTWASVGFDSMDTWADGVWLLEAKRDGQTDACGEKVSVDGGNYFFNVQGYVAPGTLACDWQANSNDLEFKHNRSGTSSWQIKATLTNPQEQGIMKHYKTVFKIAAMITAIAALCGVARAQERDDDCFAASAFSLNGETNELVFIGLLPDDKCYPPETGVLTEGPNDAGHIFSTLPPDDVVDDGCALGGFAKDPESGEIVFTGFPDNPDSACHVSEPVFNEGSGFRSPIKYEIVENAIFNFKSEEPRYLKFFLEGDGFISINLETGEVEYEGTPSDAARNFWKMVELSFRDACAGSLPHERDSRESF